MPPNTNGSANNFRPHSKRYASRISNEQWGRHKAAIEAMHRAKLSRAGMLHILRDAHGFNPSPGQFQTKMTQWGFRVYSSTSHGGDTSESPMSDEKEPTDAPTTENGFTPLKQSKTVPLESPRQNSAEIVLESPFEIDSRAVSSISETRTPSVIAHEPSITPSSPTAMSLSEFVESENLPDFDSYALFQHGLPKDWSVSDRRCARLIADFLYAAKFHTSAGEIYAKLFQLAVYESETSPSDRVWTAITCACGASSTDPPLARKYLDDVTGSERPQSMSPMLFTHATTALALCKAEEEHKDFAQAGLTPNEFCMRQAEFLASFRRSGSLEAQRETTFQLSLYWFQNNVRQLEIECLLLKQLLAWCMDTYRNDCYSLREYLMTCEFVDTDMPHLESHLLRLSQLMSCFLARIWRERPDPIIIELPMKKLGHFDHGGFKFHLMSLEVLVALVDIIADTVGENLTSILCTESGEQRTFTYDRLITMAVSSLLTSSEVALSDKFVSSFLQRFASPTSSHSHENVEILPLAQSVAVAMWDDRNHKNFHLGLRQHQQGALNKAVNGDGGEHTGSTPSGSATLFGRLKKATSSMSSTSESMTGLSLRIRAKDWMRRLGVVET